MQDVAAVIIEQYLFNPRTKLLACSSGLNAAVGAILFVCHCIGTKTTELCAGLTMLTMLKTAMATEDSIGLIDLTASDFVALILLATLEGVVAHQREVCWTFVTSQRVQYPEC